MRTHACPASAATNGSSASASATSATPAQTLSGAKLLRRRAVMGVPPRLRLSPLRCPRRGPSAAAPCRPAPAGTARGGVASRNAAACKADSRLGAALRRSCALADPLAQQARGAENEHQDEHKEGENVLVIAAEHAHLTLAGRALLLQRIGKKRESADIGYIADIACAERLNDAEQDSTQHRAGEIADTTQDRRGKRLQAQQEAHVIVGDAVIG